MNIPPKAKRILIVDDEPDVLRYFEMLLQDEGYETFCAFDGREAHDNQINVLLPSVFNDGWGGGGVPPVHQLENQIRDVMFFDQRAHTLIGQLFEDTPDFREVREIPGGIVRIIVMENDRMQDVELGTIST